GAGLELRLERLVRVVEALLDLDTGRLRERGVRLRVHVLGPVVVEERPLGLGRRERLARPEPTEPRSCQRRRSGAGHEASTAYRLFPDGDLVPHPCPPSSRSRASSAAHDHTTRSPSASASMPCSLPDRCSLAS